MSSLEDLLRKSLQRLIGGEPVPRLRVVEGGSDSKTAMIRLRIRIRKAKERIEFAQRWQRAKVKAVHDTLEEPWGTRELKSLTETQGGLGSTSTEPSLPALRSDHPSRLCWSGSSDGSPKDETSES